MNDALSLCLPIIFDDFVEMFCRVVVSDLWIYGVSNLPAKENLNSEVNDGEILMQTDDQRSVNVTKSVPMLRQDSDIGLNLMMTAGTMHLDSTNTLLQTSKTSKSSPTLIVEQALAKRLSDWLQLV
jgi:hypothetical protein